MKILTINNNSFKGYKNIICNTHPTTTNEIFSYFAMQLDNQNGKHLERWKEIQNLNPALKIENNEDVLVFALADNLNIKEPYWQVGNHIIKKTTEMRSSTIDNNYRKAYIKLAQLISDITKDIMSKPDLYEKNTDFSKVFNAAITAFKPNLGIKTFNTLEMSLFKVLKTHDIAYDVNTSIAKIMKVYFK